MTHPPITPWRHASLAIALTTLAAGSGLALAQTTSPAGKTATPPAAAAEATDTADPASAPASAALLPPVRTSGKVKYLTGGVGKDESEMIKFEARHWPLALEFAVRAKHGTAQFASDVDVVILDANGQEALRARSEGPFLLARLTPGHYTVQASLGGQSQQKHVQIEKDKPLRLLISWPPGGEGQAPAR